MTRLHQVSCDLLLVLAPTLAMAQAQTSQSSQTASSSVGSAPDYTAWNTRADAIEAELESAEITDDRLETLRQELVEARSAFQAARNVNGPRIDGVRQQLDALGPAPEDPSTEAPEVTARRAALNSELANLQAPRVNAQEAFSRADALIGRIDTTLRARQADALLAVEPVSVEPRELGCGGDDRLRLDRAYCARIQQHARQPASVSDNCAAICR